MSFFCCDANAIKTLTEATKTIKTQNEIQSILNTIVSDIEVKNEIELSMNHQLELQTLQGRCRYAEQALEEYKMLERERKNKAKLLVGSLIDDLGGLNYLAREVETMKRNQQNVRRTNDATATAGFENTVSGVDEVGDTPGVWPQHGIDIEQQQEEQKQQDITQTSVITSSGTGTNIDTFDHRQSSSIENSNNENEEDKELSMSLSSSSTTNKNNENEDVAVVDVGVSQTEASNDDGEIMHDTSNKTTSSTSTSKTASVQKRKIKKIIKKKIKHRPPPTLQSLNSTILMKIFEYMDAMDIVNMAQTNVLMYSKVDNIFGLGGAGFDADGRDETFDDGCSIEEEIEVEIEVDVDDDEEEGKDIQSEQQMDVTQEAAMKPLVRPNSEQSFSSATIVSIPSSASTKPTASSADKVASTPKTQNLSNPTTASSNSSESIAESISGSAKQNTNKNEGSSNKNDVPPKTPKTANKNTSTTTSSSSSSSSGGFQLSSAVAAALADKLSPMELSAIITMRDQLRLKEQELEKLRIEFNEVNSKYDGILSVNEVLNVRVQEQQLELEQNNEIAAKMNRQSSSDQEVIAFLDERVQELERQVGNFDSERKTMRNESDKIKEASDKQLSVLGDMLTFEREQMADNEKEWKSTKKLLVKEVKHCRAQVLRLEAERDGLSEENIKLKDALLSVGSSSKSARSKSFEIL